MRRHSSRYDPVRCQDWSAVFNVSGGGAGGSRCFAPRLGKVACCCPPESDAWQPQQAAWGLEEDQRASMVSGLHGRPAMGFSKPQCCSDFQLAVVAEPALDWLAERLSYHSVHPLACIIWLGDPVALLAPLQHWSNQPSFLPEPVQYRQRLSII